ncbi:hypothetical protein WN48_00956, partial [Eufriesea mexicana]
FSDATSSQLHVRLIAPYYITYGSTATMHCNHTVPHAFLHEVKFMKDDKKILQYIKDRKPSFLEGAVEGANMQNWNEYERRKECQECLELTAKNIYSRVKSKFRDASGVVEVLGWWEKGMIEKESLGMKEDRMQGLNKGAKTEQRVLFRYEAAVRFYHVVTMQAEIRNLVHWQKSAITLYPTLKERVLQMCPWQDIFEYLENGTTIKLKNVRFEASGSYSCQVSMTTPIYSETSESVQMKVIVPQTENPKITFKKSMYVVGESLEANCTSSAAHPVPHLTWYINDKEVDISLVNHYPHTYHKDQLMSATAKLTIEVSALHAGENGYLEISCSSTIPDYPLHHVKYADIRKETVSVQIIPAPIAESSAPNVAWGWPLATLLCILCVMHKIIP